MSADLYIHVIEGECTEDHVKILNNNCIDSEYFTYNCDIDQRDDVSRIVRETPQEWVGSVSWLKATFLNDTEKYVPSTIERVEDIIGEDFPVIDDLLIAEIEAAFSLPNTTSYRLATAKTVLDFLTKHKGSRCFTVSW